MNLEQLQADAEEQTAHQAARLDLAEIQAIGHKLEQRKQALTELTTLMEELNSEISHLEKEVLPDALKTLGIKDITLESGAKISLVEIIATSISAEHKEAAHAWLRDHGHGDIIKNNVTVSFGKGEDVHAEKLVDYLLRIRDEGHIRFGDLEQKESVHASTLKAFVKSQLAEGTEFPSTLFGLYVGQTVKLTK